MNSNSDPRGARPEARPRKCILVVEDELLIRMLLSEELREAGYEVIEAFNADEALAVLRSPACVDMIVSDVRMPGSMDGIALLRVVKQTLPTMPVIITSAHLQPTLDGVDGATLFITKPYRVEVVLKAVGDELAKYP